MVLTIVVTIISIIISIYITRHFFIKSQQIISLTPYLQYYGKLFNELDPELIKRLTVHYNNNKIENLGQAQFLIANTGDCPIKNIIEPLRLKLPKKNRILSVSIIHIQPEGRKISFEIKGMESTNDVVFNIPLLNKYEYFVVKIIFKDSLPHKKEEEKINPLKYEFSITADELPPKLYVEILPFNYYENEKDTSYDKTAFWIFLCSLVISVGIITSLFAFQTIDGSKYLFNFKMFFNHHSFNHYNTGILIISALGIASIIITTFALFVAISEFFPNVKPKFKVPTKLRKSCEFVDNLLEDIA